MSTRAISSNPLTCMLTLAALLMSIATPTMPSPTQTERLEDTNVLKADFRHRPPEMLFDEQNNQMVSPLKDILEEAAAKIGYRVLWTNRPFARSYEELRTGAVDIVPRTIHNQIREEFIAFLGPIAEQKRDIQFLVKPGDENTIRSYEDLYHLTIGTKRSTAYFDRFDQDARLQKFESVDDQNMAQMFINGRFDTMIILDKSAIDIALKQLGYSQYSYAQYYYPNTIGNYFGMSRKSPHFNIFDDLNQALQDMVESGRVRQIYEAYDLLSELE